MTLSSLFGTPTLGQEIASHVHPHGQDTWTVISGEAEYHQGNGIVTHLKAGDIAIAKPRAGTWCNELWPRTFYICFSGCAGQCRFCVG